MAVSTTVPELVISQAVARRPDASRLSLFIADAQLAFDAPRGYRLIPPAWEYPPFLRGPDRAVTGSSITIPISLRFTECNKPSSDELGPRVFATGDGWIAHRRDDGLWCFDMPDRLQPERSVWRAHSRAPFQTWQLNCPPPARDERDVAHLIQYPLDQIVLSHALYALSGVLIHAAGMTLDGAAMVFPGVSGAGKSTLCRLLGDAAAFGGLSDDRMFLRRVDDAFYAFGTPWAGDARIAQPQGYPLHGLYFIERGDTAAIASIAPRDALSRLLPVTTLAWYHDELLKLGLATCHALLERIPCYRLRVPRNGEALAQCLLEHRRHDV